MLANQLELNISRSKCDPIGQGRYGHLDQRKSSKLVSLTRTPREQLQEFRKRNNMPSAVNIKMKSVSGSVGQPNILRKPQPFDQVYPKRQRSNPQKIKRERLIKQNFPFYFAKEDPVSFKDAPEWYQKIGRRDDGLHEKNTHAPTAGTSFLPPKNTSYAQASKAGAKRAQPDVELAKINLTKIANTTNKNHITKDTLQNLIYELNQREDRFQQTTRVQNELGLGFSETSIRGNTINAIQRGVISPSNQQNAAIDTRFSLPTSVRNEYNEQLMLFTEKPLDMKKTIAQQSKTLSRVPQRKFKSQNRVAKHDESLSSGIFKKITESHNGKIGEAIANRATDEEDHVPIVDPRVVTQFDSGKQGKFDPYSELMRSYQPGELQHKHAPMPNKKRFGVMDSDAAVPGHMSFRSEREAARIKSDYSTTHQRKSDGNTAIIGQGLVKPDLRETTLDRSSYSNTKNYSSLINNYSYQVQLQKQITKAKKHLPNESISKLIDLSDFRADHKISKDMIITNIAANFKQHRANLRQGHVISNTPSHQPMAGSRTPTNARQLLLPAGMAPLRQVNNSVSPRPQEDPGSLKAQKEYTRQTSTDEWRMNASGSDGQWKLLSLQSNELSRASPVRLDVYSDKYEQMSQQSSNQSLARHYSRTKPTSPVNRSTSRQHAHSLTPLARPPHHQDVTSQNSNANPFKMNDRNKKRDKACSILFKAPRGADKSYQTAHKTIENRARSSTEQHLLPAVQKYTLNDERGNNSMRNKKVSVGAINGDSRPIKYSDFRLRDAENVTLSVMGKKIRSSKRNYRNGEVFRDSIQSIHQDRIAAQVAQTQMHSRHSKLPGMPQFQTLQVFREKRPACFTSPDDRLRQATIYNKTISCTKNLNLMRVKGAGTNRDTQLKTPHQMRQGLLETNFSVSFQKELDTYQTNNEKLFPRHKLSATHIDDAKAVKDSYKAHDNKLNWNLQQVSQLSRHETPLKTVERNEADKKLLQQFVERANRGEDSRRVSMSSRINVNNNNTARGEQMARLSPSPLITNSPQHDVVRSGIVVATKDLQINTRRAPQRNESSRMSMSLHSEKSKWYNREAASPVGQKTNNLAFSLSRRENSVQGTFPVVNQDDRFETRSMTSHHSSFRNF